jgi:predicted transcriptional regulator
MKLEIIDEEELVFNAIQDYLNQNKILEKNDVVDHIKSYFTNASININTEGIIKYIESLIKKRRIVEGSKLTKDIVLNNPKRKRICEYITENPGTYFNKIVKGLKISNHVVYWHLDILLKFDFIKKTKVDNHELLFNSKLGNVDAGKSYLTKIKEKSKKILDYLRMDELGSTQYRLASVLQINPKTVKKYLKLLKDFNLIEKKKVPPKETLYFLKNN